MTQTQTERDGTGRRTFIKGVATLPVAATGIGANPELQGVNYQ